MNLTDAIQHDAAAFCNPREFGEEVTLGDVAVTAVITGQRVTMMHGMDVDIPRQRRVVYVPASSLPAGWSPPPAIDYAGEEWGVESCLSEHGMLALTIFREL